MNSFRVAVIAGDGIGREVIPAGIEVLKKAAAGSRGLEFVEFPWGCDFYRRNGRMMDADGLDTLQGFDAIYLGAIGDPSVPDHVSVWELILPIRQRFDQYVNLRPMRLLPGVHSPLAGRGAGRHRHDLRARELGRGVLRGRRTAARRHARTRSPSRPACSRAAASSASRVRVSSSRRGVRAGCWRARPSRTRCSTRWCSGTRRSTPSRRTTRRCRGASTTSTRSRRGWSPTRAASTSSSPRTCSATS